MNVPVIDPFDVMNDKKMPFLVKALNPVRVKHQFERNLRDSKGGSINLHEIRVVRYKPENRCLIEYDIEVEHPDFSSNKYTLMGKARANGTDTTTFRILTSLWKGDFGDDCKDGISIPEPVGIVPEFRMLLQRKVSGDSVEPFLFSEPGITTLATRIADAAHKLHKTYIPTHRSHSMKDELRILHEGLSRVAQMKPQWTKRLLRVLESCDRIGVSTPEPRTCGIHRDFYPDQIIMNGKRLYILDFDLFCRGDPALDIGNFIGHMIELSLRKFSDPDAMADCNDAMEERFMALHGEHSRIAVRNYTLLTLVRHIYLSTRFPERCSFTEALLELCEKNLDIE